MMSQTMESIFGADAQPNAPKRSKAGYKGTSISDVSIVGAGPYGLSAAAHLKSIPGLETRVFGQPMSFWKQHMPNGMCLRSPLAGSNLSDPRSAFTMQAYKLAKHRPVVAPLPLESFIDYGLWFQRMAVPDADERKVVRVDRETDGFRLTLEDGGVHKSRRVVVSSGIVPFASRPGQFHHLSPALASHSCDHTDLRPFAGRRVLVVGGGQSALESAALLRESGAAVEVVVREPMLHWTWSRPWLHTFTPVSVLLYAPPDVGPAGLSHLVAAPNWFRRLPHKMQDRLSVRATRPAGAGWLRTRVEGIPITTGRSVVAAEANGSRLTVRLEDGSERRTDHVLLATGYRVDINRYQFLSAPLLASISQVNGFPRLNAGFESSVPGLHFLGAPAAWSFGPLMRFVAGADFAARALARYLDGTTAR